MLKQTLVLNYAIWLTKKRLTQNLAVHGQVKAKNEKKENNQHTQTWCSLPDFGKYNAGFLGWVFLIDRFLIIWTLFWFTSVFESTAYLKFAKLQYVSSGFCCRVITGSLMGLY